MSEIIGDGTARRFYEAVKAVPNDRAWQIELDGRVVKTPGGATFVTPTSAMAMAVTEEWEAQGDKIVPASMPLVGLCNAAIDRIAPDKPSFVDQLLGYARSDLLCYWADGPDDLVRLQHVQWQPVLDWIAEEFQASFIVTAGVIPINQPDGAINSIAQALGGIDAYRLAGLIDLAGHLSSVLLALAAWRGRVGGADAFQAAFLDELFQEELWGEDKDASGRRAIINAEIHATIRFLTLLDKM